MSKIHFEIVTPERVVLKEEIDQITVPTKQGEITVLPNHIPLIAALKPGVIEIKKNDGKTIDHLAVSGGFIEVLPTKVVILADTAERAEEIDEKRAQEAYNRAQKLMTEKQVDAQEYALVAAKIEKEMARLKVVRRRKSRNLPNS
ncbi:MAG: F0F1 ATP synthase subunit epsilon [Candidatus Parcubacteria bacterium]|nr:F0F1 ATP synthase subunit epsilon [Candidatus Parcubacteria bacterium]